MNIELFLKSLNDREIESLKKHLGLIEPKKPVIDKRLQENIIVRLNCFVKDLYSDKFIGKIDMKILDSFHNYWTEPNKSRTKMRFEMEKTWDLNRRLDTWVKRSKQYNKGNEPKQSRLNAIDQL